MITSGEKLSEANERLTADKFSEDFLTFLAEHGLVDDYVIRDYRIRREYQRLTEQEGLPKLQAHEMLAEKYFMTVKNIQRITYKIGNFKTSPFLDTQQ